MLLPDELEYLGKSKRCAGCNHLWALHTSCCYEWCLVDGCKCECAEGHDPDAGETLADITDKQAEVFEETSYRYGEFHAKLAARMLEEAANKPGTWELLKMVAAGEIPVSVVFTEDGDIYKAIKKERESLGKIRNAKGKND